MTLTEYLDKLKEEHKRIAVIDQPEFFEAINTRDAIGNIYDLTYKKFENIQKLKEKYQKGEISEEVYDRELKRLAAESDIKIDSALSTLFNAFDLAAYIETAAKDRPPEDVKKGIRNLITEFNRMKEVAKERGKYEPTQIEKRGLINSTRQYTSRSIYWTYRVSVQLLITFKEFYETYIELINFIKEYKEIIEVKSEEETKKKEKLEQKIKTDITKLNRFLKTGKGKPKTLFHKEHQFELNYAIKLFLYNAFLRSLNFKDYLNAIAFNLVGRYNYVLEFENRLLKNIAEKFVPPEYIFTYTEIYHQCGIYLIPGVDEVEWNEISKIEVDLPRVVDSLEKLEESVKMCEKRIQIIESLLSKEKV